MKHRRKIRVEWREPKLLILYLSDHRGRIVKDSRPWIDGTMKGPDHLMELLAFHLHRLGAARAKARVVRDRMGRPGSGTAWTGSSGVWAWTRSGSSGSWTAATRSITSAWR